MTDSTPEQARALTDELDAIEQRAKRFKALHAPPGTLGDFALTLSDVLRLVSELRRSRVALTALREWRRADAEYWAAFDAEPWDEGKVEAAHVAAMRTHAALRDAADQLTDASETTP